eukprot:TRINITY_DN1647_c0_g1_i7.p1 TRINITY_DN1647_c0_g1~~TRINITY_DN1647_c0_g1_i7.p1  ORF type:complete len:163 (-),score=6.78 TRINITY_DN1647_c0_g1_i7:566-1054(-)
MQLVLIDFETTGLIRKGRIPGITEIAAVHINSGNYFYTLARPPMAIESRALLASGIEPRMLQGQPEMQEALQQLGKFLSKIENPVLVAHNGARYKSLKIFSCCSREVRFDTATVMSLCRFSPVCVALPEAAPNKAGQDWKKWQTRQAFSAILFRTHIALFLT